MRDHTISRSRTVTRRGLLYGAAGMGAALGSTGLLTACETGSTSPEPSVPTVPGSGGSTVTLPTYQPLDVVEADLPGNAEGLPEVFFKYPRPAPAVTDGVPGSGGPVSAMFSVSGAPPVVFENNEWWQGLNQRLGIELDLQVTPLQDYGGKLSTVIAGGDIPDLVQLREIPRVPELLEAEFEDLTEYLSGDAVLEYPALAALPEYMWDATIYRGGIRAIPPGVLVPTPNWIVRGDLLDDLGVDLDAATDAEQVAAMFAEVTDPTTNRYALTTPWTMEALMMTLFRTPFNWAEADGQFTHMFETEEYRAGIEFFARLWSDGVIHPDSFGGANQRELFRGGRLVFMGAGGTGWSGYLDVPGIDLRFWAPPAAEGGGLGSGRLGTGVFQLCAIRKQDSPDRVRELLRVLNYFAAPFGTAEYLYARYGEEGTHFDWKAGDVPVVNDKMAAERFSVSYLAAAPQAVFTPDNVDVAQAFHEHLTNVIPDGKRDAAANLTSATAGEKQTSINGQVADVRAQVIQGAATLDEWDRAVEEWRANGGDAMRGEYEQDFAERHG